ncbi:2-oxoglutarate/Fe(II)-dependent dioxygenase [Salix suchowensis]|nr:2-oxoglutarate/Fe(II)-dependent dioxygenase [Salix suchowensis]
MAAETASPLPSKITSIKTLAESPGLTSIPATYAFTPDLYGQVTSVPEGSIPVIDYSLLISGTPGQRSEIVHELGRACQDWGFFMVINHGVPQKLLSSILDGCRGFFDLEEEEKQEFKGNHVLDPIRSGTSFNVSVEKVFYWRDFLKVFVHPVFYSPTKPAGLSEISLEYSQRVREIARGLLTGISESLGLEESYIEKAMDLERGKQIFIANLYPTYHGLLTLLIQNGIGGLQIQHKGKWVNVGTHSNSFLVNTGDHLEILSNGRYKSVLHRAMVNRKGTRMSIAMAHGPSLDSVISPAPELLVSSKGNEPAAYIGMKYKDYLELQQSNKLNGKSCLDRV